MPGDSEERNQGSVSSGAGKEGKGGKPAGILTGLFTGNPVIIVKGKVSEVNRGEVSEF